MPTYGITTSRTCLPNGSTVGKKANCICCLVGIRTQESFNRWRAIHSDKNYRKLNNYKWTRRTGHHEYNAYPIYDWKTTDIWTANGRFNWDYNRLYDLYHKAGVPISRQRVASPFISQAIPMLALYRAIDPDTWGRMVGQCERHRMRRYIRQHTGDGLAGHNLSAGFLMEGIHELPARNPSRRNAEKLSGQTRSKHKILAGKRRLPFGKHNKETESRPHPHHRRDQYRL